ncbi:MAG: 2-C-methyl-D-erythritol 4-phosphate cytidylyltransferase [Clostridiales bacterium]|nr:2-C-methyl-D-erythritol 4-phosphate cytidylyltransferase [Clostridiales bacterium]
MNAGIILAGGKGERITGYNTPKQFLKVCGKMIISYCLDVFAQCKDIDIVCVVADKAFRAQIGEFIYAEPGASRQTSIYNGLKVLKKFAPKNVVIHDSARPLVTTRDISELLQSAEGFDGATPCLPVNETIYRSLNGLTIEATLNRDELVIGQTPECYNFEMYFTANEKFAGVLNSFRGSSEVAVKSGMKISLAKGNPDNFKITTNADLKRFREFAEKRQ